jgi:hypothetical protein
MVLNHSAKISLPELSRDCTVEFENRFPSKTHTLSFPTPHSKLNLARKPFVRNFSSCDWL